jgi:hypothetical protein
VGVGQKQCLDFTQFRARLREDVVGDVGVVAVGFHGIGSCGKREMSCGYCTALLSLLQNAETRTGQSTKINGLRSTKQQNRRVSRILQKALLP